MNFNFQSNTKLNDQFEEKKSIKKKLELGQLG